MKIISRIYDQYGPAKQVVHNLEAAGFPHSDIIIVSRKYAEDDTSICDSIVNGAGMGAIVGGVTGLLIGLNLISAPIFASVLNSDWIVSAAIGMIIGAATGSIMGSIINSFTSAGISKEDARLCIEASKLGKTIVSLRLKDQEKPQMETAASQIMDIPEAQTIEQFRNLYSRTLPQLISHTKHHHSGA